MKVYPGYHHIKAPLSHNRRRGLTHDIANEEYGLFSNNCAHAVQRSLQEAGVLPYETTVTRYFNPGNLGYTISFKTNDNTFLKPSAAFSVIKSNIPSGKSYFKSK